MPYNGGHGYVSEKAVQFYLVSQLSGWCWLLNSVLRAWPKGVEFLPEKQTFAHCPRASPKPKAKAGILAFFSTLVHKWVYTSAPLGM